MKPARPVLLITAALLAAGAYAYASLRPHPLVLTGIVTTSDVIVSPRAEPGTSIVLRSLLYNRGYGSVEFRAGEDDDRVTI